MEIACNNLHGDSENAGFENSRFHCTSKQQPTMCLVTTTLMITLAFLHRVQVEDKGICSIPALHPTTPSQMKQKKNSYKGKNPKWKTVDTQSRQCLANYINLVVKKK